MTCMRKTLLICCFIGIWTFPVLAQLPPNQPEQDCFNAIPVCQNIYSQTNSYQGGGVNPNEINSASSCLLGGEVNDVWYIFTVQTSGNLCFSITPNIISNDYDWGVYNLTNNSCADIFTTPSIEVSCNFSGASGVTGPNGLGGSQNNPCIPVLAGQTYVINVSNWSGTGAGYTLNFSASTAAIFDNVNPELIDFTNDCSATTFSVEFSENIVCSTVDAADFTLVGPGGPYTVTNVTGAICAGGGTFENEYEITVAPPITATGMFYLSLVDTVEDNCGNVGIYVTDSVALNLTPTAVTATPDTICPGDPSVLSTSFSPSGYTFFWVPGNLTTATPTVSPTTTTTYNVLVTDPSGCPFAGSVEVFVRDLPTSDFAASPMQICPDGAVTVTYSGTASPNANYTWDFAGGQILSGSGAGPYQIAWATSGIKTISLMVEEWGCESLISNFEVTVLPLPTATFSAAAQVCAEAPLQVTYTGLSSPAATFVWDFGSATVLSGSGAGPYQLSWGTASTQDICLTVTDNGCESLPVCRTVTINANPQASIAQEPGQCLDDNSFTFQYNGTPGIVAYAWNLGNTNSLVASPTAAYNAAGIYPISLQVTDGNGCTGSASSTVEVYPEPQAAFATLPVCLEESMLFFNQSTVPAPGAIGAYSWNFGNSLSSTESTPSMEYGAPGIYTVELVVSTRTGCLDTVSQEVTVYPLPAPAFDMESVCAKDTAQFQNFSTIESSITNDQIAEWRWEFGDGGTAGLATPAHVYQVGGFYPVTLTATSDKGCETSITQEVEIYPEPGMPDMVEDTVCFGDAAQLIVVPNSPGVRVDWFQTLSSTSAFQDGLTYVTPPLSDRQTWYVEVITDKYCRGQRLPVSADLFTIGAGEIIVSDSSLEMPNAIIQFELISNVTIGSYLWDFGDGQASDEPAPAHEYLHPGIQAVSLRVEDLNGCVYELQTNVEIIKPLVVLIPSAFSPNGDGYNDDFLIGHRLISNFSIQVFNRWGQLVFESQDPDFRWDGHGTNGAAVGEGVYIFHVQAQDIEGLQIEETGTLTLLR